MPAAKALRRDTTGLDRLHLGQPSRSHTLRRVAPRLRGRGPALPHQGPGYHVACLPWSAARSPPGHAPSAAPLTRQSAALFMHNMLIRPTARELDDFGDPEWTIFNAGMWACAGPPRSCPPPTPAPFVPTRCLPGQPVHPQPDLLHLGVHSPGGPADGCEARAGDTPLSAAHAHARPQSSSAPCTPAR